MPFSGIDDVPARVKKFWKNIGASASMKRQWVHVFNSCSARGLSDARCFRQANGVVSRRGNAFIANAIPENVEIIKADTTYGSVWQFPITMTREGVQNGFFKDIEELRASAYTANVPILYGHPHTEDGSLTAATRIHEFLGFTSNALIDEDDLSLKATGNIFDIPDNQPLIDSIRNGEDRDVSVGFFTDEFQADGEYQGVKYKGVEINIAFDHLAILPNGHGACAQSDRCGIGVNMTENKEQEPKESKPEPKADLHGHIPGGVVGSGPQSILTSCLREHVGAAYFSENPADITRHLQLALDCYKQRTEGQPSGPSKVQESSAPLTILQKKEVVMKVLKEMGFDEADLEAIDYDAIYYFIDCDTCSGATDTADYEVTFVNESLAKENVTYTFTPAWGSVNKSDLPRDAFMVMGDPEKKSTWKLPFKFQGKVHCGAIRAIRAVLAGARGGVQLSSEDRTRVRRTADRHFAACQRIRERGDSKESIVIQDMAPKPKNEKEKDLNTDKTINIIESKGNTMSEETVTPPAEEKKTSPTEAELIAIQTAKITELVAANAKLTETVEALTAAVEERKSADEKARKDAFEVEKREVYEMNFKYRIYPDDAIAHADEKSLKLMKSSLVAINSRKEDLRGVVDLRSVGFQSAGTLPLTIGDLSKKVQTPKVK